MKYYSETLNKIYDTQEELISAECAYKKKLDEQKKKARENYNKLLKNYWKDYGDYDIGGAFRSLFDIIGFGE